MLGLDTNWKTWHSARSVTKWTQTCDRPLAILTSYIRHTNDFRQYCQVDNTAQHCRWCVYFKTRTLLATLKSPNQTQGVSCGSSDIERICEGKVLSPTTTWKDMLGNCWTVMGNKKVEQPFKSFKSLFGWSSVQTGRTWTSGRIIKSMLTNCLKMLVLGANWKTWHSVVGQ